MRRYQNMSSWPNPSLRSQAGTPCAANHNGQANSSTVPVRQAVTKPGRSHQEGSHQEGSHRPRRSSGASVRRACGTRNRSRGGVAPVEPDGEQLGCRADPTVEKCPNASGTVPDFAVPGPGRGNENLSGPAWRWRRVRFSIMIHSPGVRSRVHYGILFCALLW